MQGRARERCEELVGHALARVETLTRAQLRLRVGDSTENVRTFRDEQDRELRGAFEPVLVMQTAEHRLAGHPGSPR